MIRCDRCKRNTHLNDISGMSLVARDKNDTEPHSYRKLMVDVPQLGDICKQCAYELRDKIYEAVGQMAHDEARQFMASEPPPPPPPLPPLPRRIKEDKQPEKRTDHVQETQPIADDTVVARGIATGIVDHLRAKYFGDITTHPGSPISPKDHYGIIIDNLTPVIARLLLGRTSPSG